MMPNWGQLDSVTKVCGPEGIQGGRVVNLMSWFREAAPMLNHTKCLWMTGSMKGPLNTLLISPGFCDRKCTAVRLKQVIWRATVCGSSWLTGMDPQNHNLKNCQKWWGTTDSPKRGFSAISLSGMAGVNPCKMCVFSHWNKQCNCY